MMYKLAVILLIAWVLGWAGVYEPGSFVHVPLLVAFALLLYGLLSRRRTLA